MAERALHSEEMQGQQPRAEPLQFTRGVNLLDYQMELFKQEQQNQERLRRAKMEYRQQKNQGNAMPLAQDTERTLRARQELCKGKETAAMRPTSPPTPSFEPALMIGFGAAGRGRRAGTSRGDGALRGLERPVSGSKRKSGSALSRANSDLEVGMDTLDPNENTGSQPPSLTQSYNQQSTGPVQPPPSPGHASQSHTLEPSAPGPAPKRLRVSTVLPAVPDTKTYEKYFRVLHQVICSSEFHKGKPKVFSTVPTWTTDTKGSGQGNRSHLDSRSPVVNVPEFIKKSGDLSFLVFRYYRCSDAGRWDQRCRRNPQCDLDYEETIVIVSDPVQQIVNGISRCKSDTTATHSKPNDSADFRPGYDETGQYSVAFFYHHREALIAAAGDPLLQLDLRLRTDPLWVYIEMNHGQRFDELDSLTSQGLVPARDIPMLFCPNETVISASGVTFQAHVLREWPQGGSPMTLECWSWGYDGYSLRRRDTVLTVNTANIPTGSVVKIADLWVFPIRFAPKETIQHLKARGEMFWGHRYQSFVAYEGWDLTAEHFYTHESRWMVDYKTYQSIRPDAETFKFSTHRKAVFDQWSEAIPHHTLQVDEANLLIMPPHIHAFSFKTKTWHSLLTENIRPVIWNKDAFDRLVLPSKMKDMIKSLVMVRAATGESKHSGQASARKQYDIVSDKGKGLTMLLHGDPGTGKTLTAESVAELAQLPLYSITCGDMGTKPEIVASYLENALMLASRWNCVLLLDNADILLEERSPADLERNSIVSVFLRTLEHYDGILVLTSNRVRAFDEDSISRVQVTFRYEALDADSRRRIWLNFFALAVSDKEDIDQSELTSYVDHLANLEMNGRQIRNVFKTARQMAQFKKETLAWSHVEQALMSARDFRL